MEQTERSQDNFHQHVLESVSKICRSNKKGFKEGETEKLDAIRDLLKESGYHEILLPNAQIWRKDFSAPIDIVVSSHADVVKSITKCSSNVKEKDGFSYYKGTYDNAGTNAALVISMLEGSLPDNAIFAFTADEETGRCHGAKQVLEYARSSGYEPICIALDVTYEGYDEGYLFTVENLTSGHKNEDQDFLNEVASAMMGIESEDKQSCSFVKVSKNAVPSELDKKYVARDTGWFDEAQAYGEEHVKAMSICLPCEGEMHANSGVLVKEPAFEGYVNALEYMIHAMAKSPILEQIKDEKKEANVSLLETATAMAEKEAEEYKKYYSSHSATYNRYRNGEMSEDEYYDYLAYNQSYGVHGYDADYDYDYENMINARCGVESWYDPDVYPSFKDYVDCVIEDIVESAYSYEADEREPFIEDALYYIPDDVMDWFGEDSHFKTVLDEIFDLAHGIEKEDPDKEENYQIDDETSYEYDDM